MHRPNPKPRWSVWLMPLLLAACSGGSGSAGDDPDTTVEVDADTDPVDTFETIDTGPDTDDAGDIDDASDTSLAQVGELCEEDVDCESELCEDVSIGAESGICTMYCEEDAQCPRDFDCILLSASGADARRVCLPVDLCVDLDGDERGVGPGCLAPDCDEDDPSAYFGATERCDGVDNDCDDEIDEQALGTNEDCETGFLGVCAAGRTQCVGGELVCRGDLAPTTERCDTFDNDCDGAVDEDEEGATLTRPCYDGDTDLIGTGVCAWGAQTCTDGGFSACIGQVLPSVELCDGEDNDCDGEIDEEIVIRPYYPDLDGDGFGDAFAEPQDGCAPPPGFVDNHTDCDDTLASVHPGAAEVTGDGIDQDCDGGEFCFEDADEDGYRRSSAILVSVDADCDDPGEATADTPAGDCDDGDATSFPGGAEACDGDDNDCDDRVDEAAMCYPNGEACIDDLDCRSSLCLEGVCTDCRALGVCPDRLASSTGGGRRAGGSYVLELSASQGTISPVLSGGSYRLTIGPGAYATTPVEAP